MIEPIEAAAERADLETWLAGLGRSVREVQPLTGDVSPRRYARLSFEDGATAILATYPPDIAPVCPRFLRTTEILEGAGVRVPRVLAAACDGGGWMLLEDLGLLTLGDWKGRSWSELAAYFEDALGIIDRITGLPAGDLAELNPTLGCELLKKELAQTWEVFLAPRGLTGNSALAEALRAVLDSMCDALGSETPVPCHRDFMARNLMPLPGTSKVAVLDHQDLRLGPPFYDLASLLNDTVFPPPEAEEALLAAALPSPADRVRYHRAAAQRTLKAVGTYAAFARRGADRHLPLIGPTLSRSLRHLALVPESAALAVDLGRVWGPVSRTPEG
ncbi:MAG TPA: phosphotransferase [Thermoanaerobaculia bacterium]|nr:phosphotransferase [Thermoanaerobaculia bacterium]